MFVKHDFLVRPTFPPRANCFINEFGRHRHRYLFGLKRRQEKSRTREDKRRTRPGHRVQGRGQSVWPGLVSVARGQQQDKRRTRQDTATEQGHRVQGRDQSVWPGLVSVARGQQQDKRGQDKTRPQSPATEFRGAASQCGQLFFSKIEPQQ